MLIHRLITAAAGVPLLLLVVWVGGALLAAVAVLAVFLACMELAMARGKHRTPLALLAALCGAALPAIALAGEEYVLGGAAGVIALVSAGYVLGRQPQAELDSWLWGIASALYFGALASFFVLLREAGGPWDLIDGEAGGEDGRSFLLFVLLTVWTTDTGAYAVGRAIGRHSLAPAISPGKTVEGSFGSLVAGFAAVFVLDELLQLHLALEHRVVLGLLLPLVITLGDLAESALKRALAVKDSSGLVPGHGGIADRLDSLLFATPALYYYLKWIVL